MSSELNWIFGLALLLSVIVNLFLFEEVRECRATKEFENE